MVIGSSPYRWLEEQGPACHLIALIDGATSRTWGRLVEHDSTEGNLRTLRGWLERYGRRARRSNGDSMAVVAFVSPAATAAMRLPVLDANRKPFRPAPPGLAVRKPKPPTQTKIHCSSPPDHPWRKS